MYENLKQFPLPGCSSIFFWPSYLVVSCMASFIQMVPVLGNQLYQSFYLLPFIKIFSRLFLSLGGWSAFYSNHTFTQSLWGWSRLFGILSWGGEIHFFISFCCYAECYLWKWPVSATYIIGSTSVLSFRNIIHIFHCIQIRIRGKKFNKTMIKFCNCFGC